METAIILTPEISVEIRQAFLKSADSNYQLVYTDYRDTLEDSAALIEKCMQNHSLDALVDEDRFVSTQYEAAYKELDEIENRVKNNPSHKHFSDYIDLWIEKQSNTESIIDAILERDSSDPLKEMIERTKFRARVELYSKYDCQVSSVGLNHIHHYYGYFKDMVDLLCLNPAKLQQVFNEYGFTTEGIWPDIPDRNPAVRYQDFAVEIENQIYTCLFVFLGMFPLNTMYGNCFRDYEKIIIPKGNKCGMFSSWHGCGSCFEMELIRDLEVPKRIPEKTEYDGCEIIIDEKGCGTGFCIDEVYGMDRSVWGKELIVAYPSVIN
jgi:hypothetical protein